MDRPDVYRALADPTRREILDMLSQRDRNVGEMAAKFVISLPAVSRHLRTLRQAGLVTERSEGRQRIYHLDAAPMRDVSVWIDRYERFWRRKLKQLARHLEEKP